MKEKFLFIFCFIVVFFVYGKQWFVGGTLSSGDWPYLFLENIKEFSFLPDPKNFWLGSYYQITSKIAAEYIGLPWEIIEKIFWFWPFLALSVWSSYYLTKSWFGVLIYTTNTYILMVVGGGQMGVALAYAVAPFVIALFERLINAENVKKINRQQLFFFATVFGVLLMFDPRLAYILLLAIGLYVLLLAIEGNIAFHIFFKNLFIIMIAAMGGFVIFNAFWVIPLLNGTAQIPKENIDSIGEFQFLSFTDFSKAFSFLHPNWPENIFGKTYFIRPEFILLPILAFSSLLFLRNTRLQDAEKRRILFFMIIGLLGVFLTKGAREPFGAVNEFLFANLPGMSLFRDSTKFFLLIALSYSILIPFSLEKVLQLLQTKFLKNQATIATICAVSFLLLWIFLIKEAVRGELRGTFVPSAVPQEYIELKDFFINDNAFYKTLWIPQRQRFGFESKTHPAISGQDIFRVSDQVEIAKKLIEKRNYELLKAQKVRYVILPSDPQGELFSQDRKYSDALRNKVEKTLSSSPFLSIERIFGATILYRFN